MLTRYLDTLVSCETTQKRLLIVVETTRQAWPFFQYTEWSTCSTESLAKRLHEYDGRGMEMGSPEWTKCLDKLANLIVWRTHRYPARVDDSNIYTPVYSLPTVDPILVIDKEKERG